MALPVPFLPAMPGFPYNPLSHTRFLLNAYVYLVLLCGGSLPGFHGKKVFLDW